MLATLLPISEIFINAMSVIAHSPSSCNLGGFCMCVDIVWLIWGDYLCSHFGAPWRLDFTQAFNLLFSTNLKHSSDWNLKSSHIGSMQSNLV